MDRYRAYYRSPVGYLEIEASDKAVTNVAFVNGIQDKKLASNRQTEACITQLDEYFAGKRKRFHLKLNPPGTEFQKSIWTCMLDIPFGETVSYSDLADAVNNPKAVRAVGMANNKNKIVIIIPCHRVIGKNGSLTGFGSGMEKKIWLLEHEGVPVHNKRRVKGALQYTLFDE